jgi:KUP system potassium uptake protein
MSIDATPVSEKLAPTSAAFTETPAQHGGKLLPLALGALGVVYGDIGTSPLYALKECVHGPHAVPATDVNVLGLLSLLFWSVTMVVTGKYLNFIMRADNGGEGGILALLALLPKKATHVAGRLTPISALVLFGAALLYGDGIITPAVSVLSAVEGLRVATHAFDEWVIPITVGILLALFSWQHRGTGTIGRLFGPVMVVWFATIALLGLVAIFAHPAALVALNPWHIVAFFLRDPWHAFLVLGSVVLCITGAEALYADMGHFGRRPIKLAWYSVVFPALILNYFGQGALLLAAPVGAAREAVAANPFFALVPTGLLVYPLVALATAATVIASQALISGAFSVTRQAIQLGCLPRLRVKHTSSEAEGQIYMPLVNWAIAAGCIALVLAFQNSSRLAGAYGIAVTGTMAITSIAFYNVARQRWHWPRAAAIAFLVVFLTIDLMFLASNTIKLFDSGYVPIVLAVAIFVIMRTWKRGRELLGQYFARASRPLDELIDALREGRWHSADGSEFPLVRVPGAAAFMTGSPTDVPPLLLHHVRHVRSLHETVVLVTVTTQRVPRVLGPRCELTELPQGLYRLQIYTGFMESPNVPRALEVAISDHGLPVVASEVTYFLGRETLLAMPHGNMGRREEELFAFLTRNSQNATRYFGIPPERVVELGMQIDL